MIFRKNLRAGTLLYALLMLGIFSLLVQFYLQSQLAAGHAWQAKKLEGQAYFMAQMARDEYLKVWEEGKEENPSSENKEAKDEEDQTKAAESKAPAPTRTPTPPRCPPCPGPWATARCQSPAQANVRDDPA